MSPYLWVSLHQSLVPTVNPTSLLADFDVSNDGFLSASELEPIARQLNEQIQFNNVLLGEMETLEREQLKTREEAMEKNRQLGRAVKVMDAARAEANDWRRK